MEPDSEMVVYGGVAEYDQGKAHALESLKNSFGFVLSTITENGEVETITMLPQTSQDDQAEWVGHFLDVAADTVEKAREL